MMFMHACTKRAVTLLNKRKPPAVTPNRKNHGLMIPLASRGKHSSPQAKAPITATAAASVKHVLRTPNHAAASDRASINPREARHDQSPLQRAFPLHRQFGSFDHGGSYLEQARRRQFSRLQRGKSAQRVGASRSAPATALARLRHFGPSVEVME